MNKLKHLLFNKITFFIMVVLLGSTLGYLLNFLLRPNSVTVEEQIVEKETLIDTGARIVLPSTLPENVYSDQGEASDVNLYPYVDSVDGGQFLDGNGLSVEALEGEFKALGAIEQVDTSSLSAFISSTLGRCIIADNYYGAQCVSYQRAFWLSYAGYDVTTCGTGVAKGEAKCPEELARDKFKIIYSVNDIIPGTWIITDGSWTGHVCLVKENLGNGYVSCVGENQGGHSCGENVGGAAVNIINLSTKQFLIGFIPISYIPVPEPLPDTSH